MNTVHIYATYIHIYTLIQLLAHGHTSTPTCGPTPFSMLATPYSPMHTEQRTPLTQEGVRKEFNKIIRQIMLVRSRA